MLYDSIHIERRLARHPQNSLEIVSPRAMGLQSEGLGPPSFLGMKIVRLSFQLLGTFLKAAHVEKITAKARASGSTDFQWL